jgi:hypothetical protein
MERAVGEHTKTPWAARGQQVFDTTEHAVSLAYCGIVAGAGVCKDGKIRSFGVDEETAIANAAFIVKAVNSHEALVKALEEIIDADTIISDGGKVHDHGPSATIAIAALNGVVGSPPSTPDQNKPT